MSINYYEATPILGDPMIGYFHIHGKNSQLFGPTDCADGDKFPIVDELNNLREIAERLAIYTSQLHIVLDHVVRLYNKVEGFQLLSKVGKFRADFVDAVLANNNWDKGNMEQSLAVAKELLQVDQKPNIIIANN